MVSIINMTVRWHRVVRMALRLGLGLFIFALVVAAGLWYSTARGYRTWWFRSDGCVAVDGLRSGYLHRNSAHSAVIITRTDLSPAQSYLVGLSDRHWLIHCGDWHAPNFVAFPIGDVNPPCSGFGAEVPRADYPKSSTLIVRSGFVEFSTLQGRRITASW